MSKEMSCVFVVLSIQLGVPFLLVILLIAVCIPSIHLYSSIP